MSNPLDPGTLGGQQSGGFSNTNFLLSTSNKSATDAKSSTSKTPQPPGVSRGPTPQPLTTGAAAANASTPAPPGTEEPNASGAASASHQPLRHYIEVDGPVDEEKCLIRYDVPYAPHDPRKTFKLRQRLGLPVDADPVDANVRAVIDSFIAPRTWVEGGVQWVQHASPYVVPRIAVVQTQQKLQQMITAQNGRDTGVCPIRTYLFGEAFIEVIRQAVADCWERGLLLLKVHAERIMSQKAHRELYESRTGYACRLALKGEKDTQAMVDRISFLKTRKVTLAQEEEHWKAQCEEGAVAAEHQRKVDEKRYADEIKALTKEMTKKKEELEERTRPIVKDK